jgi:hypothetical protein
MPCSLLPLIRAPLRASASGWDELTQRWAARAGNRESWGRGYDAAYRPRHQTNIASKSRIRGRPKHSRWTWYATEAREEEAHAMNESFADGEEEESPRTLQTSHW